MSLPNAITREDFYLNKIANPSDDHKLPDAITRQQHYLKAIAENAGGGGGGGGEVHYSTTEQVIGAWIDGKTLYQKTFTIQNIQFNESGYYDMDLSTENTSLILAIYDASYYTWMYNSAELRNSFERIAVETDHVLLVGPASRNINIAYVTLRYTKTTDTAGS